MQGGGPHAALADRDSLELTLASPLLTQLRWVMPHRKSHLIPVAILPRPTLAGPWEPAAGSNTEGIGHHCRASGQTCEAHRG